jgi:hypothetical protein
MTTALATVIITGVLACIAGVVWLVRLEGRITGQDILLKERKEQVEAAFTEIKQSLQEIKESIKQAPRDAEAAQVLAAAKIAAQDVVAAAKVVASAVATASELTKFSSRKSPKR